MTRLADLPRKLSIREFTGLLEEFVSSLRRRIELSCEAFDTDPKAREERKRRVFDPVNGFRFFAETYFPHYLEKEPSLLHDLLFTRLPEIAFKEKTITDPTGARDVIVAPRGSAKSTLISLIYPIWRAIVGKSRYGILAADSYTQAALLLEAIKTELESNPRLASDFPEITGKGRVWREGDIVLRNNVRLQAVGSGMKLRGRRHGPFRPDFVVLDDIENDENVQSIEQRNKLEKWVLRAVVKLGPSDGSIDIIHIGTVLHHDAVIIRSAKRPGWRSARFRALMKEPDRPDLWERYEEFYRNEDDGGAAARAFYLKHKVAMDAGAVLNWPAMQNLEQLMREKIESPSTFASEQQGEPVADNAPFQKLVYWAQRLPGWLFFGAVDPSLGKAGKQRDPSAILVGGLDRSGRAPKLYLVEASIRKRLPDTIIADTIAMQRKWNCNLWFVESVQFQEFLRTELMTRALAEGVMLPAIPVIPIADKTLRIERLQPHVASGHILFDASQTTLIEQLTQWPSADHDDGPDALEMLWSGAIQYGGGASFDMSGILSAPIVNRPNPYGGWS